jgi:UDP-glucose 4-epimerase
MKIVLITGAYGFLGRHTALKFKEEGFVVYGLGHGDWSEMDYKKTGIDFWFSGDVSITNMEKIGIKFDVIVHCGGSGSVSFSLESPIKDFDRTVNSTHQVLEYIRLKNPEAKLIYPSSVSVHGQQGDKSIKITDPCKPLSPYGLHKAVSEQLCNYYREYFKLNISIIRFFSIYGPTLNKQLLWDACNKFSKLEKEVTFWGTGDETRDFIYITDATALIFKVSTIEDFLKYPILNGGSGKSHTIKSILIMIKKEFQAESVISFNNKVKEGDPKYYKANISESQDTGWTPKVDK